MSVRKLPLFVMLALLILAGTVFGQTLDTVRSRGTLICGVNQNLPGFGSIDEDGDFVGFDIDFCHAIAAAVLGDAEAVEFRPLSATERFTALQSGEIDVLIRNSTWTSTRDVSLGLNWAPTTFYDGQGFIVRKNSGIETLEDLDGFNICVQTGTTTERNLADTMATLDIDYTPLVFQDTNQSIAAYDDGACEAFTTDKSGLVSRQTTLRDPGEHTILDATISKEPLGPAVRHGDDQWYDIVKWTVLATFLAEEFGVDSMNASSLFESSESPQVRRLLGADPDRVSALGLDPDAFLNAITQVGNYAEIYDRHLGPDTIFDVPRGLNSLYLDGGLLYSPPM
ncbi:MAG: amino acid ABC transporter substrate-binding protein [Truepera sp.]|nr:amino acid ABC transporter substrate-binding protein [Truepera sp.]